MCVQFIADLVAHGSVRVVSRVYSGHVGVRACVRVRGYLVQSDVFSAVSLALSSI